MVSAEEEVSAKALAARVRRPRNRIRDTGADLVFTIVNTTLLIVVFLLVLYPLVWVVSASFSDPIAVGSGRVVLLPVDFTVKAYKTIFQYSRVWSGYMNSIFYAVVGTLVNVGMTILAAYPLSRRDLYGKNFIMGLFVFSMMFSGGLIPFFLIVNKLGMYDTRWAIIIPQALSIGTCSSRLPSSAHRFRPNCWRPRNWTAATTFST
jgi:putative aldouronate transport system permease protein